jgi:hypothetical protein
MGVTTQKVKNKNSEPIKETLQLTVIMKINIQVMGTNLHQLRVKRQILISLKLVNGKNSMKSFTMRLTNEFLPKWVD